jgi:hypothetical protein
MQRTLISPNPFRPAPLASFRTGSRNFKGFRPPDDWAIRPGDCAPEGLVHPGRLL